VLATKLGESSRPEFVDAYGEYLMDAVPGTELQLAPESKLTSVGSGRTVVVRAPPQLIEIHRTLAQQLLTRRFI